MSRLPVAAIALALLATTSAAFAKPHVPDSLSFTVLRNGDAIGSHKVLFQQGAGGLKVAIDTNIVVKILMVPVYRFVHHDQEVWQDGHLLSLSSVTNDDGKHHHLKVAADAKGLEIKGDDKTSLLPTATIPASLWNPATVTQGSLMNTLDGHPMKIHVKDLGTETVSVHGQPRPAHHYAVTGDLAREVWYDADGNLVQVRFKADDKSDIRYVLN